MSDLQVIYDPSLEIAAIVDLDTNMGWGPICPGPQAANLLQSFVDGMPFDITILSQEQARDIFLSVFREDATQSLQDAGTDAAATVDTGADPPATDAAQATAEAVAAAGAPPDPAPADADMAADESQADTVTADPTVGTAPAGEPPTAGDSVATASATTNCLVCNAQGTGSNNPACPVCGGSGQVAVS